MESKNGWASACNAVGRSYGAYIITLDIKSINELICSFYSTESTLAIVFSNTLDQL